MVIKERNKMIKLIKKMWFKIRLNFAKKIISTDIGTVGGDYTVRIVMKRIGKEICVIERVFIK